MISQALVSCKSELCGSLSAAWIRAHSTSGADRRAIEQMAARRGPGIGGGVADHNATELATWALAPTDRKAQAERRRLSGTQTTQP